jgi:hypothetical protein
MGTSVDGDPRGLLVRVTGKFDVTRGKIPARSSVKVVMEGAGRSIALPIALRSALKS